MPQRFVVRPSSTGWCVESPVFPDRLEFRSGARAEAAARTLARRHAEAGESAEVQIILRDATIAGVFYFEGRPASCQSPPPAEPALTAR
jgi:hypothetical protein